MKTLQYLADHWAHIWAGLSTAAIVIIHRGGIWPIARSLWDSTKKQTATENQTKTP